MGRQIDTLPEKSTLKSLVLLGLMSACWINPVGQLITSLMQLLLIT